MLSAVPCGLRGGERCCYGRLTARLWQLQPVPSLSEPKGGGGSYHNMEPMLLNVIVVERLQITSFECHKRCHMHTAATVALAVENKMVSIFWTDVHQLTRKEKQNEEVHS